MIKGVVCVRGHVPMDEHKRCMNDPLHPCGLTEDVLNLMTTTNTEREDSGVRFSPSTIQTCQRQAQLSKDGDYFVPVEGVAWAQTRGNLLHALMEDQPAWDGIMGTVRELRMRSDVETRYGTQTFMGKADLIVLKHVELVNVEYQNDLGLPASRIKRVMHVKVVDYKTVSEVLHRDQADDKHERQVNLYAWLAVHTLAKELDRRSDAIFGVTGYGNGILSLAPNVSYTDLLVDEVVVDELEIFYADFKKTRRFTSAGHLSAKGKRLPDKVSYDTLDLKPLRKMSEQAATRWIVRGIEDAIAAETELPPPLTYHERPFTGESQVCVYCPVRERCIDIAYAEGYDATGQGGGYIPLKEPLDDDV